MRIEKIKEILRVRIRARGMETPIEYSSGERQTRYHRLTRPVLHWWFLN